MMDYGSISRDGSSRDLRRAKDHLDAGGKRDPRGENTVARSKITADSSRLCSHNVEVELKS